jgi:Domain of unknown function (DUF4062)
VSVRFQRAVGAGEHLEPMAVDMVGQSDVYVGIIGLRYGALVRDRPDVSYTELEFEAAGERGQPRLIFLISEDSAHPAPANEVPERRARQEAFRRRLRGSGLVSVRVGSPPELELAAYQALVELAPTPGAPARLAAAQALFASMPTDILPPGSAGWGKRSWPSSSCIGTAASSRVACIG